MHLLIAGKEGCDRLVSEVQRRWPESILAEESECLFSWKRGPELGESLGPLVFCRQLLPDARFCRSESIRGWGLTIAGQLVALLAGDRPWRLHVTGAYVRPPGASTRCAFIRNAVLDHLKEKHRTQLRSFEEDTSPWTPRTSLVQLLLLEPEKGFLSMAVAPLPWIQRKVLVPFPAGEIFVPPNPRAPSRAFAKLVEAEHRLGIQIGGGETCVDLGAAPGSWSYHAVRRGARVLAVDRSELRQDLMRHPHVRFVRHDAFAYHPEERVDWLLCDLIAEPTRTLDLLETWLTHGWMKRLVVTLKFKGREDPVLLERAARLLASRCEEFFLTRLCSNRNEACAMGIVSTTSAG